MNEEIFKKWKKVSGERIDDIEKYIFEQLAKRDDISIMIGTDSILKVNEDNTKRITYLSVIVFHMGRNGCHVIMRRDVETRRGFVATALKLNGEINRTSELALWFRDVVKIDPEVHLDVNPKESAGSFEVYNYIKGYFESLGFITRYKPDGPVASICADYFL